MGLQKHRAVSDAEVVKFLGGYFGTSAIEKIFFKAAIMYVIDICIDKNTNSVRKGVKNYLKSRFE